MPLPRAPIDLARRGAWSAETTHAPRVPDVAVAAHRRAQPIRKTFPRGLTSARAAFGKQPPPKRSALTREKQNTPKKHKKHPPKAQKKHPQTTLKHQCFLSFFLSFFLRAYARKKNAPLQIAFFCSIRLVRPNNQLVVRPDNAQTTSNAGNSRSGPTSWGVLG